MIKPRPEKRNTVIYNNEFLYTSFDATGFHFNDFTRYDPDCKLRNLDCKVCSGNLVRQLHRIQGINYGFSMNYADANQFGQGAYVEKVTIEQPDATLDFEYFLADGYNEEVMGFIIDGEHSALHHYLSPEGRVGSNFFITVAPEGRDVIGANLEYEEEKRRTIGFGNSFLTQYAVTAELGAIPKARASFEVFNIRSYDGICNLPIPAIDVAHDCGAPDVKFSLPDTYESFLYHSLDGLEDIVLKPGVGALRPGDIQIDLDDGAFFTKQLSGLDTTSYGAAHVQGFTINIPLGATKVQRLGRRYEFARVPTLPAVMQVQVKALVADLKEGVLFEKLCHRSKHDLILRLNDCSRLYECSGRFHPEEASMIYYMKNAMLDQETFSSSVSDNKIVDLNFTVPIGSKDDKENGLFIFGRSHFPDRPALVAWGNPVGGPIGMYPPPSRRTP